MLQTRWTTPLPCRAARSALVGDRFAVMCPSGDLFLLDAHDGAVRGRVRVPVGSRIVAASAAGLVLGRPVAASLRAEAMIGVSPAGDVRWERELPGSIVPGGPLNPAMDPLLRLGGESYLHMMPPGSQSLVHIDIPSGRFAAVTPLRAWTLGSVVSGAGGIWTAHGQRPVVWRFDGSTLHEIPIGDETANQVGLLEDGFYTLHHTSKRVCIWDNVHPAPIHTLPATYGRMDIRKSRAFVCDGTAIRRHDLDTGAVDWAIECQTDELYALGDVLVARTGSFGRLIDANTGAELAPIDHFAVPCLGPDCVLLVHGERAEAVALRDSTP